MANVALGYGVLTVAVVVLVLGAAWLVASTQKGSHERVDPLRQYAPCVLWITGPTPEVVCKGGRGFVYEYGGWQFVGHATPVPAVPR